MFKNMFIWTIGLCMMFAFPLIAQTEGDVFGEESGKTGPHTQILPNWSIKKEVSTIEKSLESYDPLIQSLEEANNDLKMDLAEYLKKPGDQVLAGKITAKMSKYAKKIVANVDTITENQDVLLQVFTDLNQKLQQFDGYLNFKATELKVEVEKYELKEKELKKQLKDLALKIKDTQDPNLQEQYKKEFRQMYTKYNLYVRYKDGFTRNYQDYETLAKNLQALVKMFGMLNDAFSTLLGNLESEKKYLIDNIRLQADAIRVQKLVHEGISDGSKAVVKVSQKLALLYTQVEGFAKVHEKINRDMAKFTDSTKILSSLVEQIEKSPYQSAPTIDKAIDYFADLKE